MENILLFIMVAVALITYKKYPLSQLSYSLLITFLLLHLYGARYTYENNPLGLWFQSIAGNERNSYDRIVHFSFGVLWTYPIYEILRRYSKVQPVFASIGTFTMLITLASIYELIEWIVGRIFFPEQGAAFIGLQGDVWDTQKDIALALVGSLITLTLILCIRKHTISSLNA
jgi:putative membrane protein